MQVKGRRSSYAPKTFLGNVHGVLKKMRFKLFSGKQEPLADPFAADVEPPDILEMPTTPEAGNTGTQAEGPIHRLRRQRSQPGPVSPEDVCYESQSPDEAALVHAARAYGFILLERTPDHVTVRLPGGTCLTYEVLDILTFDSTRKRMSVLVRHPRTHQILLYTKGADSAVMELLEEPAGGKGNISSLLPHYDL